MDTKVLPEMVYENGIWKGSKKNRSPGYFRLGEMFLQRLKDNPDIIGQIDGKTGESETYGSIYDRSVRCALWLKQYGVGHNDVVGYCSANNMHTCIPYLACFYIGSIFNPWWNDCLDEEIIKFFIDYTQPKVIFADKKSVELILKAVENVNRDLKIIVFGEMPGLVSISDILNEVNANEIQSFECTPIKSAEESASIIYTSGTTTNPKGALHSYGSMAVLIELASPKQNIMLWFANLCWLSTIISTMAWISTLSTAIISNSPTEEEACQLISKFSVTYVVMGTAAVNRLSKAREVAKYNLSSITSLWFGGSIAHEGTVQFLLSRFKNAVITTSYGGTECIVTGGVVSIKKLASCGRVGANHEIKVVDSETDEILGPNKQGLLCCRGSSSMKWYWNNPELTNEVMDSDGWYRTGDIGYYDDDGYFFITDRIKELIKYRLYHIPPAVIENVILSIPGIAEVGVVAKPHNDDLEQPTAFITLQPDAEITEDDIHKKVEDKLHDWMKLRGGVYFLDKMPVTSSGKISKRQLRILAKMQSS